MNAYRSLSLEELQEANGGRFSGWRCASGVAGGALTGSAGGPVIAAGGALTGAAIFCF